MDGQDSESFDPATLLATLTDLGVALRVEAGILRYTAPAGVLTADLKTMVRECRDELLALLTVPAPSPASDVEPFPLTELQQAYLVGEQAFYDQHAPAVFYHEYAADHFVAERLEHALRVLCGTHDVLRLSVSLEGTQCFLAPDALAGPVLAVADLSALSPDEADAEALRLRSSYALDMPPLDAGRPFLVRLVKLPTGARLQVALRLIAFDGITTQLFFGELARCYEEPSYRPSIPGLSYRDYVLGLRARLGGPEYKRAERYWTERIPELPAGPGLPRSNSTGEQGTAVLRRLSTRLTPAEWAKLRSHASAAGVPVGSALCALFAETVHRWSDGEPALLTVLAAHRPPLHADVGGVWGNCSTTVLVAAGPAEHGLAESAKALQRQLYTDLAAMDVSGVDVGRRLQRHRGNNSAPAPVVFTSGLDLLGGAPGGFLLKLPGARLVHSAISTPQVLLDHQVYEEDDTLVCNFDFNEDVYPRGMLEQLSAQYETRLCELARDREAWHTDVRPLLPEAQVADRRRANHTTKELRAGTLYELFEEGARLHPDRPAVIAPDCSVTYAELDAASSALAARLVEAGLSAGELVAVFAPKGPEQVAGVLAVLRAGGAYLPVDLKWPDARVRTVLDHSGVSLVVTGDRQVVRPEAVGTRTTLPARLDAAPVDLPPVRVDPASTAYVIYTSGSTGMPKGVVTSHAAVVNTVRDLVDRFGLDERDRLFGVSSLAFDLSVFDLFASFSVGAALVLPPDAAVPDPQAWGDCVERSGVTVWNSVPALMDMLVEYLGAKTPAVLASLRLVMLSGDWVPLPLLDRLRESCPDAAVMALGGATEASIWSNLFPAADQPDGWTSVPYGYPLANQSMHVLDRALADSPTWVPGDLYIGGRGVAEGYLHDPERTAASFLTHPRTGERLYRTGDRARYRPGGILEFLGRDDFQVKIRGFRIELGEIEAQLLTFPGTESAVALVEHRDGEPRLAAFVTGPAESAQDTLRAHLAARLPAYMVPATVRVLDAFPLSANGKVDRKALSAMIGASGPAAGESADTAPATVTETRLLEIWQDLLGPRSCSVTDDFFAVGGNSLLAVRLFQRVTQVFGVRLELSSLFANGSVRAQASMVDAGSAPEDTGRALTRIRAGAGDRHVVFVHPVGGNLLCYREIVDALDARFDVHGLRAAGLRPGEPFASSVGEMASAYAGELVAALGDAPLHLVGWSMGGTVALSLAAALAERGHPVVSVVTVDSFTGDGTRGEWDDDDAVRGFFTDLTGGADLGSRITATAGLPVPGRLLAVRDLLVGDGLLPRDLDDEQLSRLFAVYRNDYAILLRHRPTPFGGQCVFALATRTSADAFPGLRPLYEVLGREPVRLDEDHFSAVTGAGAQRITELVTEAVLRTEGVTR